MSNKEITINGIRYSNLSLINLINHKIAEGELWEQKIFEFLKNWYSKSDKITLNTSGSTGNPKKITFYKTQLKESAKTTINYFNLKKETTALLCLPADYVAAKLMIVRAITGSLNLVLIPPDGNPLDKIDHPIDFAAMVPLQLINGIQENYTKLELINKLIVGGQKIPDQIVSKLKGIKTKIWETYGMTETLTHVAVRPISPTIHNFFKAIGDVHFETDDRGCLAINCAYIQSTPIVTNDLAELKNHKEFRLIGRYDNTINSGGIKIHIEELENKILPHLKEKFAISSIEDCNLGEKIVLVIENIQVSEQFLQDLIKQAKLTKYESPKMLISVSKIPLTSTGKTDRYTLRNMLHNQ